MIFQLPNLVDSRVFTIEHLYLLAQLLPYVRSFGKNKEKIGQQGGGGIDASKEDSEKLVTNELPIIGHFNEFMQEDSTLTGLCGSVGLFEG